VTITTAPRDMWEASFRTQGMQHPEARMAMLDGFNQGWIDFAVEGAEQRIGAVDTATVLRGLVARGQF
jgi:NAD(P)H dehydrogenase (quinone)